LAAPTNPLRILQEVGSILVEPALTAATQERGNECRRGTSEPGIVRKGNLTMDQASHDQEFSQWARSIDTFETTVKRISELPDLVYFEIKE
jgi:hypothetical protein